jgi:hypothetical protein
LNIFQLHPLALDAKPGMLVAKKVDQEGRTFGFRARFPQAQIL